MTFGTLLRQLRTDAGLTQEELAEAAGISARSVSDLERGINLTARKDTARLLADALRLTGAARAEFEAAARGRAARDSLGGTAAATKTLPRDIRSFTGREPELRALVDAAAGVAESGGIVGIHAIGGMAGVGKTAFAVHAAHILAARFPAGQIFLPLHGHTPGHRPVDAVDALASLLLTVGIPAAQIPPGLEARMALWRDRLADRQLLLLLDDAADSEQVRPLLPGTAGSLVLVTSRRHLTALEDAQVISLDILAPSEAAGLLVRLAGRPDLKTGDTVVEDIIRLCGYLPLAIGMLARQLHHHPAWTPAGLASDLAEARDRLELMTVENLSVNAAFDLSYQDLTESQQQGFRRLGLHPGMDIDAYAATALGGTTLAAARRQLDVLYDLYLITEPVRGRYRLHDLIREHARALAVTDPPAEADAAVSRLLDYYLHTARAAGRNLPRHTPATVSGVTVSPPADAPDLPTRDTAVAWLNAERLNLNAAADYAALRNLSGHTTGIATAMHEFLRGHGHWDQAQALHQTACRTARRVGDRPGEAGALTDLGQVQQWTGNYTAAVASLTRALRLCRDLGSRLGEATALLQIGVIHYTIDEYPAATASLTQALELYRHLGNRQGEASALGGLAVVQALTGDLPSSAARHEQALELYREIGDLPGEARALIDLGAVQSATADYERATASLTRALQLNRDLENRPGEANALKNLGIVEYRTESYRAAADSLTHALELYRDLGHRPGLSDVYNYLGLLAQAAGDDGEAIDHLTRALGLFRELSDRAGEAEAHLNLGTVLLTSGTPDRARTHYEQARQIATAISALLLEASALEGIGQTHLDEGEPARAAGPLRQALTIYQRRGSPRAHRVELIRPRPRHLTPSGGQPADQT